MDYVAAETERAVLTRPRQTSLTGLTLPDQFEGWQFPDKLRNLGEEVIVQQDNLQYSTVQYITV